MSRTDQIKQERRRRRNLDGNRNRMAVNESLMEREKYEYRFINDIGSRVHDLTVNDDWEVVTDRNGDLKTDGAQQGAQVSLNAGTAQDGKPMQAILVRKLKSYYNDDFAARQRQIDDQEAALKQGAVPGGDTDKAYVPNGEASAMKVST